MPDESLGRLHRRRAVAPHSPDHLADLESSATIAQRIDFPDLGIAPNVDRIGKRRLARHEQPRLGIPVLLQVRVRTSVRRELGSSRDAGVERTDAYLSGTWFGCRILPQAHNPRLDQLHDVRHQGTIDSWRFRLDSRPASATAVVRLASSESRELSGSYTATPSRLRR